MLIRTKQYRIVTVNVLYFIPDYRSLLNVFTWQTVDIKPRYPRIHRFLDYWQSEIDAVIKEVTIHENGQPEWPLR